MIDIDKLFKGSSEQRGPICISCWKKSLLQYWINSFNNTGILVTAMI